MAKLPWLSALLLFLSYLGFGAFLHSLHSADLVWWLAAAYAVVAAASLTIVWKPIRNVFMLGFKSDVGYTILALVSASLAVAIVAWIWIFVYFLVTLAASLLLRVELLVRNSGNSLAFVIIVLISLAGLGVSRFAPVSLP